MDKFINKISLDDTIKILTITLAFLGLLKALFEYTKAQKWKKAEFLAKEMKEFFADVDVKNATLMLDWNEIEIHTNCDQHFLFTDNLLKEALKHHKERTFPGELATVRQIFDNFLFKLGMFQSYIESNLVSKKDLEPYLKYWIEIIADPQKMRKNDEDIKQLWKFINNYEYEAIVKLFKNFGYNIELVKEY